MPDIILRRVRAKRRLRTSVFSYLEKLQKNKPKPCFKLCVKPKDPKIYIYDVTTGHGEKPISIGYSLPDDIVQNTLKLLEDRENKKEMEKSNLVRKSFNDDALEENQLNTATLKQMDDRLLKVENTMMKILNLELNCHMERVMTLKRRW